MGGRGDEARLLDQLELGLERVDVLLKGCVACLQRVGLACRGRGVARLIGEDADQPEHDKARHQHGASASRKSQPLDRLEGTVRRFVVRSLILVWSLHR